MKQKPKKDTKLRQIMEETFLMSSRENPMPIFRGSACFIIHAISIYRRVFGFSAVTMYSIGPIKSYSITRTISGEWASPEKYIAR
jgi:hypothetical protein